jgi:hypothetical protein
MLTRIGVLILVVVSATSVSAHVIEIQPFAGGRFGGGFTVQERVPGGYRGEAHIHILKDTNGDPSVLLRIFFERD